MACLKARAGRSVKKLLLTLGWILATVGLYAALVGLEFYWNMPDWHPLFDSIAAFLVAWCAAMIVAMGWLARRTFRSRLAAVVSLIPSLALGALAICLLPPEALSSGLFGRVTPSPLWYRWPRTIVMLLPLAFWLWNWRRRGRTIQMVAAEPLPETKSP